ncbi:serine--tRNA ligase, partial [Candidatus Halocynthiibacter alkanivorans]|uniref:serine--tRNA ligase n=1 Tax=Candidatus Halocynthiibacter alkanivorans TaxID=2267619 RepID=UPI000DF157F6
KDEANQQDVTLRDMLMRLPNVMYDDVPDGADESDNVEVRKWGTPVALDFEAKEHFEITGAASGMDFETAAKLSGSRFVILKGAVARIHRALAQFMLNTHVDEHDLTECNTPIMVLEEMMYGTGQLPKFGEDSYKTTEGMWLIPTSEVTLTNMVNGETVEEQSLPMRFTAHTLCFRSEAGSAGRDTSGMLRQHQFEKVEMVSVVHPDESEAEHARMTGCAEAILEKLNLPYRTVKLCAGDQGFGMKRTHDMEVWLPGQNQYREISSVSTAGDYQARRMNARFKPTAGGKPEFVHTLNGSGLAIGRCLIAVLENGQNADGSVTLPKVLAPYLGGKLTLSTNGKLA